MSQMRETVAAKIDKITAHHEALKNKRFGFLVRPLVLTFGWLIVLFGMLTIPLPGPGWVTVFVGIGILSLELHWASKVLSWGITQYDRSSTWYQAQSKATRWGLFIASCVVVWIAVGASTYIIWRAGGLPVMDPVMHAIL
ncbi:TIGR02611 family protein [Corynebacterium sp. HS2168-gen11]|uniref:TIGR02611 family protein n=1 Tax=Corynebacterium sp. HS2168-gen11 TaxID=2974027 RepID=UPI00286ED91E|nr:TIGR02611 family protein [Corynebacterium sp. HS2168-gen11]